MPIRPKKKPAWKLEQEKAATIAGVGRTHSGALRNYIADEEDRTRAEAERRQRDEEKPTRETQVSPQSGAADTAGGGA